MQEISLAWQSARRKRHHGLGTSESPLISLNGEKLEVIHQFQYLGSTASDILYRAQQTHRQGIDNFCKTDKESLRKQASIHFHQDDSHLSTLSYGTESWTTYSTRNGSFRCFIYTVSGGSSASSGWTRSLTTMYSPSCANAIYIGLSRSKDGRWTYPKRYTLWQTCNRWKRSPTVALQRCMQEKYESLPHPTSLWKLVQATVIITI